MTSTGALAQYQYPEKGLGLRFSSANQRKIQIDRQGIVCRGRPRLATGLAITAAHKKGAPACLNEALRRPAKGLSAPRARPDGVLPATARMPPRRPVVCHHQ